MIEKGDNVSWNWGEAKVSGTVVDTFSSEYHVGNINSLKNNTREEKALLIEMSDGRKILKMEKEVQKSNGYKVY